MFFTQLTPQMHPSECENSPKSEEPKETSNLKALSPQERLNRLVLSRSENVGPVTFHQLLSRYGSATQALIQLNTLAARGGSKRPLKLCSAEKIQEEIKQHERFGAQFLVFGDPEYPEMLCTIPDPPPILSIKGQRDLLKRSASSLAIVGSRNASINGRYFTRQLAKELGEAGHVVVSGLAQGIDTSAHEAALKSGTVAVLAGGIDQIYPPQNATLYHQISHQGLLISENPFGLMPHATLFPRRNRLISGLSQAVLVIEATLRSGSLITARYALEQGREVFAVPGSPLDPRCRGTNKLIQEGAPLIQGAKDVLDALSKPAFLRSCRAFSSQGSFHLSDAAEDLSEDTLKTLQHHILVSLSFVPISVDELFRECHCSRSDFMCILLELELAGHIWREPGGLIRLAVQEKE